MRPEENKGLSPWEQAANRKGGAFRLPSKVIQEYMVAHDLTALRSYSTTSVLFYQYGVLVGELTGFDMMTASSPERILELIKHHVKLQKQGILKRIKVWVLNSLKSKKSL